MGENGLDWLCYLAGNFQTAPTFFFIFSGFFYGFIKNPQTRNACAILPLNISPVWQQIILWKTFWETCAIQICFKIVKFWNLKLHKWKCVMEQQVIFTPSVKKQEGGNDWTIFFGHFVGFTLVATRFSIFSYVTIIWW